MSKYNTLKYNCEGIENEYIALSIFDAIKFYLCLDCALKMLLSDKADALISYFEQGFDAETQAAFIQSGTSQFNLLN
jgi:hypothetical protein